MDFRSSVFRVPSGADLTYWSIIILEVTVSIRPRIYSLLLCYRLGSSPARRSGLLFSARAWLPMAPLMSDNCNI